MNQLHKASVERHPEPDESHHLAIVVDSAKKCAAGDSDARRAVKPGLIDHSEAATTVKKPVSHTGRIAETAHDLAPVVDTRRERTTGFCSKDTGSTWMR